LIRHLAGIVPVSGLKSDFNMPWHESLMPIGPNYLAVERAVAECAYAGCDTIWIVCSDDITPLIRYQIGGKIQDPVYNYRHFETNKNDVKKPIRIYYVPLAIKDINKRDNLAWSAIFGAQIANKILGSLSSYTAPDRFYISWPYGYYDPWLLRDHRKLLINEHVVLVHKDETVKQNKYLAFTVDADQIKLLVQESITTSSGLWREKDNGKERLPLEERYSYKNFDLNKVFNSLDFSEIRKPSLLKYSEWNEIGIDD